MGNAICSKRVQVPDLHSSCAVKNLQTAKEAKDGGGLSGELGRIVWIHWIQILSQYEHICSWNHLLHLLAVKFQEQLERISKEQLEDHDKTLVIHQTSPGI